MNPQIQDQIAALDRDPDELHADRTPAVARLIELGQPALLPLYAELDHQEHLHRMRAQRAIEGITRRSFGFNGSTWPDGALEKWTTWWQGIAYDAEATPTQRAAAIARLRQWGGGDRNDVNFGGPDNQHPAARGHRHCRRYFCGSCYQPIGKEGPRPPPTRDSRVATAVPGRDQAPEEPGGVGTSRTAMLCAIFSDLTSQVSPTGTDANRFSQ